MISTAFQFSRQNSMHFSQKIDVSDCQIWLKLKFCSVRHFLLGIFSSNLVSTFWRENSNIVEITKVNLSS